MSCELSDQCYADPLRRNSEMKRNMKYIVEKKRAPGNLKLDPSSVFWEIKKKDVIEGLIQNGIKGVMWCSQGKTSPKYALNS